MLVTVKLPWWASQQGKTQEVYRVELVDTELDGKVCELGYAEALLSGERIRLPPYIPAKDVAKYLQAQFGAEYRSQSGACLD